jgi:hypothetical protein
LWMISSEVLRGFYRGFNVVSEVNEVDFGCFSMLVCLKSCKSDQKALWFQEEMEWARRQCRELSQSLGGMLLSFGVECDQKKQLQGSMQGLWETRKCQWNFMQKWFLKDI